MFSSSVRGVSCLTETSPQQFRIRFVREISSAQAIIHKSRLASPRLDSEADALVRRRRLFDVLTAVVIDVSVSPGTFFLRPRGSVPFLSPVKIFLRGRSFRARVRASPCRFALVTISPINLQLRERLPRFINLPVRSPPTLIVVRLFLVLTGTLTCPSQPSVPRVYKRVRQPHHLLSSLLSRLSFLFSLVHLFSLLT